MATGRIRRSARRGLVAAALGWLGVATAAVVLAPSASAAPTATVTIRDFTPPVASVDAGGTVTFVNDIADKRVVIDGPVTDVTVVVHTDVTLSLPSGDKPLARGQEVTERFRSTCTTCAITFTYRAEGGPLSAVIGQLEPLPARTPFVVQTILPDVPALPSVSVPQLPAVEVPPLPAPGDPPIDAPGPGPEQPPVADGGPAGAGGGPAQQLTGGTVGDQYVYPTSAGVRMSAADAGAAAAFDPSRFSVPSGSIGSGGGAGSGSGGLPGGFDGASVPVFGELAGLDGAQLDEEADGEQLASSAAAARTLPAAALAAVVALATVTAALVRTHQAQRTGKH